MNLKLCMISLCTTASIIGRFLNSKADGCISYVEFILYSGTELRSRNFDDSEHQISFISQKVFGGPLPPFWAGRAAIAWLEKSICISFSLPAQNIFKAWWEAPWRLLKLRPFVTQQNTMIKIRPIYREIYCYQLI